MQILFEPPPKTYIKRFDIWTEQLIQKLNRLEQILSDSGKFFPASAFSSLPSADAPVLYDGSGALPSAAVDHASTSNLAIVDCAHTVSATDKIVGRASTGAGIVEEIDCTSAGRALLDDDDATAQRATLGLGDSATKNVGTGATEVSAGNHNHSGIYARIVTKATTGHPVSAAEGDIEINTFDNKVFIYSDADWRQLATW